MKQSGSTRDFSVTAEYDGYKIKDYMIRSLGFSTALIARVKFGGVYLCGEPVHMRAVVHEGDTVSVNFPDEVGSAITPINIPLEVLYEDEDILAVNKPIGMPTHPSRGNTLPTLAAAVVNYLGEGTVFRAVSRLDKDTSGIVIIAKNAYSAAILGRNMKDGKIKKEYTAIVKGMPTPSAGIIEAPIERAEDGIKRCVREDGKYAKTEYETVGERDGNAIVRIKLHTGRTHQIRVHMAYLGNPLLNDALYSENADGKYLLHCHRVELEFCGKGKIVIESAPHLA